MSTTIRAGWDLDSGRKMGNTMAPLEPHTLKESSTSSVDQSKVEYNYPDNSSRNHTTLHYQINSKFPEISDGFVVSWKIPHGRHVSPVP